MSQRETLTSPLVWRSTIEKNKYTGSSSASSNDDLSTTLEKFPIDHLPIEILFMILERVDAVTLVNCMHVSKKWKAAVFYLADGDQTKKTWETIFNLYHEEATFSSKSCGLLYKDLFANLLRWNLDFTVSMYGSCWVNHIKKINIYRDNIIVVDFAGVKYYDVFKHNIKKSLVISECLDFDERDTFVLRTTEIERMNEVQTKLFLYGKTSLYDDGYEHAMQNVFTDDGINHDNSILVCGVAHYVLEKNRCYVMSAYSSILTCYTWEDNKQWNVVNMGRYYSNQRDNIYAMTVLNREILLLSKWGQLISYCYESRNYQEVHRVRLPTKGNVYIKMVHKYCLVIGVPEDNEFRITRIKNNDGYNYYKFECPNLSCSTQHGEVLFLGFRDGKVEIFLPRIAARKDMLRRRLHLADFTKEPLDPQDRIVLSIDVYEDYERHFLFISTCSAVHHLVIEHSEDSCVWDNIPMRPVYYKYPIRTKYAM